MGNRKLKLRNYWEMIPAGIVAAGASYLLSEFLMKKFYLNPDVPNALLVGEVFGTGVLLFCLLTGLIEHLLRGIWIVEDEPLPIKRVLKFAFAGALATACFSGTLEWIYELSAPSYQMKNTADVYCFAIDDSGSMSGNDRNRIRYSALTKIIDESREKQAAGMLRFSSEVLEKVDAAVLDADQKRRLSECMSNGTASGDTNITDALISAHGICTDYGHEELGRSVVLLSDGVNSDGLVDSAGISKMYNDSGISISTIALGTGADRSFLREIAKLTGGVCIELPTTFSMDAAYAILSGREVNRCLLLPRLMEDQSSKRLDLEQMAFLFLIGMAVSHIMLEMFMYSPFIDRQWKYTPVKIAAGAVLMAMMNSGVPVLLFILFFLPLLVRIVRPRRHHATAPVMTKETHMPKTALESIAGFTDVDGFVRR